MNRTFVNGSGYPQEKVQDHNKLPMNNKNLESSHIGPTQERLKEPKEIEAIGNSQQPRAEDPIPNLYKLMIDRQSKNKLVYFEVDETTKEVIALIPSYGLEKWKKEKAA
jgi:hypothetical protein